MKSIVVLSLLVIALSYSPARAGVTRVLRDTETDTKQKDPAPAAADGHGSMSGDDSFMKTLQKALGKLRRHGSDMLKTDLDTFESALKSGALDETVANVKKDLDGSRFDFKKLLTSFSSQASGDYGDLITRISTESNSLLERLQKHAHHAEDQVKAFAGAAQDLVQAAVQQAA